MTKTIYRVLLISSLMVTTSMHAMASDTEDNQRDASVTCQSYNSDLKIEQALNDDVYHKQETPAFYQDITQVNDIINSYKERDVYARDKGINMNKTYLKLEADCKKSENADVHIYDLIFHNMNDYIPSVN